MKKSYCFLLLLFFTYYSYAQKGSLYGGYADREFLGIPYYTYGKGLGMTTPDSAYQMNIRFRMQNRAQVTMQEKEIIDASALVRRLRLRLDGFVYSPQLIYVIQLSFATNDVGDAVAAKNVNIIRDAIIFYKPNKHWTFGFGQTKLPGNRQRVNSSGALQLPDRSIANSTFNIDRDFGAQVYYANLTKNNFGFILKTALSTGKGRNWTSFVGDGCSYTGRVELFPFGSFKNNGVYFEGDLEREQKPKLMIAGTYSQNINAIRTLGQRGELLYQSRNINSIFFDAILKYKGLAVMLDYMMRESQNPITVSEQNSDDEEKYVMTGSGTNVQLSYNFVNNYEIVTRYSNVTPHKDIWDLEPNMVTQYTIGANKYLRGHNVKLQFDATYNIEKNQRNHNSSDSWIFRIQVELGI